MRTFLNEYCVVSFLWIPTETLTESLILSNYSYLRIQISFSFGQSSLFLFFTLFHSKYSISHQYNTRHRRIKSISLIWRFSTSGKNHCQKKIFKSIRCAYFTYPNIVYSTDANNNKKVNRSLSLISIWFIKIELNWHSIWHLVM